MKGIIKRKLRFRDKMKNTGCKCGFFGSNKNHIGALVIKGSVSSKIDGIKAEINHTFIEEMKKKHGLAELTYNFTHTHENPLNQSCECKIALLVRHCKDNFTYTVRISIDDQMQLMYCERCKKYVGYLLRDPAHRGMYLRNVVDEGLSKLPI